jgi:hypothetical protein
MSMRFTADVCNARRHDLTPLSLPYLITCRSAYQERKKAEQKAKWAEKKKTQQPAEQPTAELIQFNVNGEDVQANVEDVKRCFSAYGTVKWVHYNRGETEGHVQVTSEAKAVCSIWD